jgi:putative polymerase
VNISALEARRPRNLAKKIWHDSASPRASSDKKLSSRLVMVTLFTATVFNLGLCFINTKLFTTSAQTAMLAEVIIMATAISLLLHKRDHVAALVITILCSYFAFLFLIRGAVDPKPVRDLLIPIVFVRLGQKYLTTEQTDWLITRLTLLALAVSIFEFAFPDIYTRIFDVLQYFINKGATRSEAADFIVNGFNINGDRPEGQGRALLPFLGLHRSGSIFLEPVTAGNFGAICGAWFLQSSRKTMARWCWVGLCLAIIVLADGRFGLMLLILAIALRFIPLIQRPLLLSLLPFAIIGFLVSYAAYVDAVGFGGGGNSYGGRLLYSGRILDHLDVLDWLGMQVQDIVYFDSGYAYSVTQIGLLGLIVAWIGFTAGLELKSVYRYLGCFCLLYVALSLIVSNSMWSIKASALLWFMVGQTMRGRNLNSSGRAPAALRSGTMRLVN